MALPDNANQLVFEVPWLPTSVAHSCQADLSDLHWDLAYVHDRLSAEGYEATRTMSKFVHWCEEVCRGRVSLFMQPEVFKRGTAPRLDKTKHAKIYVFQR